MTSTDKTETTMSCGACNVSCQRFGKHRNGLRRFRCPQCKRTYTESHRRTLDTMYISEDRAVLALQLLLEGNSIRSTERITKLDRNTIMSLLVRAGERCKRLMDEQMRNLHLEHLQIDEIWTYVQKKARRIRSADSPEVGDQWVFVALDETTKLVPAFHVGKRHQEDTREFLWDLYNRMNGKTQITTDGLRHYTQLVKLFGEWGQHDANARYSPSPIVEVLSKVRTGNPDPDHISTSHVERQNLTMRMAIRRFTRLTNAFSKKLANLKAAVALHFAYYNFCRVHSSLRVTPAMEAGITDHIWTLMEMLSA